LSSLSWRPISGPAMSHTCLVRSLGGKTHLAKRAGYQGCRDMPGLDPTLMAKKRQPIDDLTMLIWRCGGRRKKKAAKRKRKGSKRRQWRV
jgi:hypothetical protein